MQKTQVWSLEKEMTTHSSVLAWENPMERESWWAIVTGSQRVRHNWATRHIIYQYIHMCFSSFYIKTIFIYNTSIYAKLIIFQIYFCLLKNIRLLFHARSHHVSMLVHEYLLHSHAAVQCSIKWNYIKCFSPLFMYLFIWHMGSLVATRELWVAARGSTSPTRDETQGPLRWEIGVLATGLRGNSAPSIRCRWIFRLFWSIYFMNCVAISIFAPVFLYTYVCEFLQDRS